MKPVSCMVCGGLPAITVRSIDIDAKVEQELDYVVMPGAHRVMEWGDAFIVGSAGVFHLKTSLHAGEIKGDT